MTEYDQGQQLSRPPLRADGGKHSPEPEPRDPTSLDFYMEYEGGEDEFLVVGKDPRQPGT